MIFYLSDDIYLYFLISINGRGGIKIDDIWLKIIDWGGMLSKLHKIW